MTTIKQETSLVTQSDDIAKAINQAHYIATAATKNALRYGIECGGLLVQAKGTVKHGEWEAWLRTNCPAIGESTARLYRSLYDNRAAIESSSDPILCIADARRLISDKTKTLTVSVLNSDEPAFGLVLKKPKRSKPEFDIKADLSLDIVSGATCVCGCDRWLLTDGGRMCNFCGLHEDSLEEARADQATKPAKLPDSQADDALSEQRRLAKEAFTEMGRLVRAVDKLNRQDLFEGPISHLNKLIADYESSLR